MKIKKLNPFKAAALTLAMPFAFVLALCGYYNLTLPDSFYVKENGNLEISTTFPLSSGKIGLTGEYETQLELFGTVPVKNVAVQSVEEYRVIPSGQPFGIKILSDGIMVISLGEVFSSGKACSPAADCGICVGDLIMEIDGQTVLSNSDLKEIIADSGGETLDVRLVRGDEEFVVGLTPAYSERQQSYCAGIWVRDSSAGIGTITFVEPQSSAFGGLGHAVCDAETDEMIPLGSGRVNNVCITGVTASKKGSPGELRGSFRNGGLTGIITANSACGVFGILTEYSCEREAIPIALKQEICKGAATVLTTVCGEEPKEYEVEIKTIDLSDPSGLKSMVVEVTDSELLDKTGGIVRGMSGSPIIQDGKLVGALTHVFVNNPRCGYAVFAETMYENIK